MRILIAAVAATTITLVAAPPASATTAPAGRHRGQTLAGLAEARQTASPHRADKLPAAGRRLVLLVKVRPGDVTTLARRATAGGATVRHQFGGLGYLSIDVPAARATAVAADLSAQGATVTRMVGRHLFDLPDDNLYSHESTYLSQVGAPAAWDVTHGSSTIKVAVVDSGVDVGHPDLAAKIAGTYNAVDGTTDVTDTVGHGTFVAGIVGADTNNGQGIAGAGYDTGLLAVKVADAYGAISVDDEAAGINWAVLHGAKVINLSLGSQQYSDVEAAAVAQAQAAGVVVVAAAGNDGTSTPNYPAALPNVLSVGATDASGSQASFSSYGSWVKVGAPGTSIYSTTPTAGSDFFAPGSYDTSDGTSFASPIVAAEVALLAAYAPGSDAATLRGAITSSAHAVSGAQLGAGEVDFATALSHLPPQSTPTFTAPTAAATVGGPVALTVTSGSPSVRFSVDGVTVGSLVSVSSDTAQISWSSWGVGNGSHTLGAADCNTFGCGPAATESVDVENSAPSLVAPAAAEVVAGAVTVTATSDAPAVRFAADGATLTTVATTSGTAGTSWMTWGVANGTHALTATACDGVGNCAAQSASRSVTIANAAPAITSPTSGQSVGGTFAVTATAPGGGVAVLVDGTRRGFDGSAPYSIPINWSAYADGTHTVSAVSCDQTGTVCNGPAAPAVSFVVKSLHPSISGAISPFSPNGDGRRDSSTLVLHIADTETAVWRVYNASNVAVVSVRSLGTLAKGDHSFVWNGRSSSGSLVPNGAYTIVVSTTARVSGSTLVGTASRSVRVDTVAPSITAVRGANSRVYPVKDGYRDSVTLGATVSEPGSLTARIYNPAGALVRTLVLSAPGAGAYSIGWTGRSASGALLPAGAYHFAITAADVAGNRRTTSRYAVTVSLAKLVTKTLTLTKAGDSAFEAGGSSPCAGADASVSDYPNGLWLGNACDPEWDGPYEIAAAFYTFSLPAALAYTGLKFQAYGYSFYAPSEIDGAAYNYGSATYDSLRSYAAGDTPGWYTMSTPAVTGHVSSTRVAKFAFDVADDPSGVADFDIDVVRLVVTYQVLG